MPSSGRIKWYQGHVLPSFLYAVGTASSPVCIGHTSVLCISCDSFSGNSLCFGNDEQSKTRCKWRGLTFTVKICMVRQVRLRGHYGIISSCFLCCLKPTCLGRISMLTWSKRHGSLGDLCPGNKWASVTIGLNWQAKSKYVVCCHLDW